MRRSSSINTSRGCRSGRCRRTRRRSRRRCAKPARVSMTDAVQLPRVVLAWHSPAGFNDGDPECDLLVGGARRRPLLAALSVAGVREEARRVGRGRAALAVPRRAVRDRGDGAVGPHVGGAGGGDRRASSGACRLRHRRRRRSSARARSCRPRCCTSWSRRCRWPTRCRTSRCASATPASWPSVYLGRYDTVTAQGMATWAKKVLGAPHVTVVVEPEAAK